MVSANLLLQKLQPFNNKKVVVVEEQTTGDIINGIVGTSKKYASEYDKILPYFEDDDIIETAKNVFDFLKKNCIYIVESTKNQTLRSPSSIIATGKTKGCDCKSYSLFFMGILSAYIRKYKLKNNISFRFAGYDGKEIGHVFVVFNDNGKEYWCDCVLDYFNDRSKTPTKFKDKNMALVQISGVPKIAGLDWTSIGKKQVGYDKSTMCNSRKFLNYMGETPPNNTKEEQFNPEDVKKVTDLLQKWFGAKKGEADTPYAEQKYLEMYPDVAAAGYPAWAHYQQNGWKEGRYWFDNPSVTKETIDDYRSRYPDVAKSWDNSILQHYLEYGKSEGRTIKLTFPQGGTGGGGGGTGSGTTQAGISTFALLGLIGAGVWFFLKSKKK